MRSASRAATLTCWSRTRAWGPAVRSLVQRQCLWECSLVLAGRRATRSAQHSARALPLKRRGRRVC